MTASPRSLPTVRSERADLLLGADGIRSTVRGLCAPGSDPLYAGYVAWRALIAESAMPREVHRDIFPYMAFCLPPGEQMLGYPVAGADNDLRPGHLRYNMVWYRPADERTELVALLTDENGVAHSMSIPPPLISKASIAAMRRGGAAVAGAAIRRGGGTGRAADPAADLRSGIAGASPSGGWRSWAMPPSSRGRMSAPASPRPRAMRRRWSKRSGRECRRAGGAAPLRSRTPAGREADGAAGAPSRRLSAGRAQLRRSRAFGAAFDSGSGAGRNRDAGFSVRRRPRQLLLFFFFFFRFTPAIFSSTPQTAPVSCSA